MIGLPGVWLMIPTPSEALMTSVPRGDAVKVAVAVGDGVAGVAVSVAGLTVRVAVGALVWVGGRTVRVGEGLVGVAAGAVGVVVRTVGVLDTTGVEGVDGCGTAVTVAVPTGGGATPEPPPQAQRTTSGAATRHMRAGAREGIYPLLT